MQKVNFLKLLPKREKHYLKWWIFLIIQSVILVALLTIYFSTRVLSNDHVKTYTQLEIQQKTAAKTLVELEKKYDVKKGDKILDQQAQQLAKDIENKSSLLVILHRKRHQNTEGFVKYLRVFAEESIPQVWITKIAIHDAGDIIELQGQATDTQHALQYLANLNTDDAFKGETFKVVELEKEKNKKYFNFIFRTELDEGGA